MSHMSHTDAQQRADDIRIFCQELARLENEQVLALTDAQRLSLASYYDDLLVSLTQAFDVDPDVRAKQLSSSMRIASLFGALALAASIFFLFYQFWGRFPESAQCAILIAAAAWTFALTMWIHDRDPTGHFTKLSAMVAFTCFVLNVIMLGQIYNITASDKALLPWALLALILAYSCEVRLLLVTGLLCIAAFTAARVGTWNGIYWLDLGSRPENFIPVAIVIYHVPQLVRYRQPVDFASTYRTCGAILLLLSVLALSDWGESSYLPWSATTIEDIYQVWGFLLSAALIRHGLRRQWPETVNVGLAFFVIFLFTKIYDWWWDLLPKYLFFLIIGLTAVLLLMVTKRLRDTGRPRATKRL